MLHCRSWQSGFKLEFFCTIASFGYFTSCGVLMDSTWQPEVLKCDKSVYLFELDFALKGCQIKNPLNRQKLH